MLALCIFELDFIYAKPEQRASVLQRCPCPAKKNARLIWVNGPARENLVLIAYAAWMSLINANADEYGSHEETLSF